MKKRILFVFAFLLVAIDGLFAQTNRINELKTKAYSGNPEILIELSEAYRMGTGGATVQPDSAFFFARLAAETGNRDGQYLYGIALVRGLGGKVDMKKGVAELEKAAAQNHVFSVHSLIEIYSTENNSFVEQKYPTDYKKALQYALQSAKLQHEEGPLYLGYAYMEGRGVPKNDSVAVAWLDTAATRYNNPEAQVTLGDWFFEAKTRYGLDFDRAKHYYQMAGTNERSNIDQKAAGDIGAHYAVQWKPMLVNMHLILAFPEPEMAPQLRVRP